jgi:hypothetical protein
VIRQVDGEVRGAWKEYVTGLAGNAGDLRNLVRVLGATPALAENAAQLDRVLSGLRDVRGKLPDAQLMREAQEASELLDRLTDKLPEAVKTFLTESARGTGAPLGLLTAEVLAWLQANGATDEFRIVVARKGRV